MVAVARPATSGSWSRTTSRTGPSSTVTARRSARPRTRTTCSTSPSTSRTGVPPAGPTRHGPRRRHGSVGSPGGVRVPWWASTAATAARSSLGRRGRRPVGQVPVEEAGVDLAGLEGGVGHHVGEVPEVGPHAVQHGPGQQGAHPGDRRVTVLAVHDQLGQHRVVEARDDRAVLDAAVDADAGAGRHGVPGHGPRLGQEARGGILGVQPHLDGVARLGQLVLGARQRLAGGHLQLPGDQVLPGDQLGDRVLDLQPRVHLEEEELAGVGVDDELDRAGSDVVDRPRRLDRGLAHGLPHLVVDRRRRGLLDDLLVPTLDRAVTLEQVHHLAVRVAEDLDLDVLRPGDQALHDQPVVAERAGGLTPGRGDGVGAARTPRGPAASPCRRPRRRP